MNVLVETHTEEEIERAVAAQARIIGVNVRNLKTLDVDRSVFASLAGMIPAEALVIAESGVRGVDDVTHYAASGANGRESGGLWRPAFSGDKAREDHPRAASIAMATGSRER